DRAERAAVERSRGRLAQAAALSALHAPALAHEPQQHGAGEPRAVRPAARRHPPHLSAHVALLPELSTGHPRLNLVPRAKTWMTGTSARRRASRFARP